MIHDLDDSGQEPWLGEHGIELFRGEGRLDGERRVVVGDATLVAKRVVVVATGSAAAMPPIEGLDTVETWNNRDATTSKRIPRSMIVLGGGPVGAELAQAWSALGTKVTLVEGGERILAREEPFASEEVAAALREKHGVDVRTGAHAERVGKAAAGVEVELDGGERLEAEELLVAVGRKPRTAGIGLDSVGIEPGEGGFLETDARMRVGGGGWLYAVGDVTGRALFTHMGKYQAWVAAENALGREVEAISEELGPPRVTFTDPQVAAVGKTLAQAQEAGIDAIAVDVPTDGTAGASFYGKETGGTTRIVVDRAPGDDRRRHLHRLRDRRLPPRGDDRDRRRGPARRGCATPSPLTHPQRDLAQAPGEVRSSAEASDASSGLKVVQDLLGNPGTSSSSSTEPKRPRRSRWASRRVAWVTERLCSRSCSKVTVLRLIEPPAAPAGGGGAAGRRAAGGGRRRRRRRRRVGGRRSPGRTGCGCRRLRAQAGGGSGPRAGRRTVASAARRRRGIGGGV